MSKQQSRKLLVAYEAIIEAIEDEAAAERLAARNAIKMIQHRGATRARGSSKALTSHSDRAKALELEAREHRRCVPLLASGEMTPNDLPFARGLSLLRLVLTRFADRL